MTEKSRPWDGTATGDATEAPYDAPTEFAEILMAIAQAAKLSNKGGVFKEVDNALAVSGTSSPVAVNTGQAMVWGTWYKNDASVNVAIPTPAGSTRIDRIVLRKSWSSQTVRITRIAGTEGGAAPAMTQVAGTTWDVPLATVSITTGGVITVTDAREYLSSGEEWTINEVSQTAPNGVTTTFAIGAAGTNVAEKVRVFRNGVLYRAVNGAPSATQVRFPSGGSSYSAVDFGTAPPTGAEIIIEWA